MKTSRHLAALSLFLRLAMFAAALTMLNTVGAIGAVYYVATDGSDSTGNGSAETPWATITHALDMVQAALGTDFTGPVEIWPEKPGDDTSPLTMRYADGLILELSWPKGYGEFWGAKFIGEKGVIERIKTVSSDPPELAVHHIG